MRRPARRRIPVAAGPAYQEMLLAALGDDDPAEAAAEAPGNIRALIAEAGDLLRVRPEPREWSALLCLAHIADAEVVMSGRYRWVLAHDRPELIGYDQDLWVDRLHTRRDDPSSCSPSSRRCGRRTSTLWRAHERGGSAAGRRCTGSAGRRATTSCSGCSAGTIACTSRRPAARWRRRQGASGTERIGREPRTSAGCPAVRSTRRPRRARRRDARCCAAACPSRRRREGRLSACPTDYPTLEAAIAASQRRRRHPRRRRAYPGGIVVPEDRPGITIRGESIATRSCSTARTVRQRDRGRGRRRHPREHDRPRLPENGFYWEGVDGFAGRYLTVWNVGLYGIYAIESRTGSSSRATSSGAADAAFYIGECNPCDTDAPRPHGDAVGGRVLRARTRAATSSSRTRVFENNGVGILPNSFDVALEPPPQRDAIFRRQRGHRERHACRRRGRRRSAATTGSASGSSAASATWSRTTR